jgi:coniferyl-aldehyde dehydrogenase
MDQPSKSPGQSALENAFHRLFEQARTTPARSLGQRLDRLRGCARRSLRGWRS